MGKSFDQLDAIAALAAADLFAVDDTSESKTTKVTGTQLFAYVLASLAGQTVAGDLEASGTLTYGTLNDGTTNLSPTIAQLNTAPIIVASDTASGDTSMTLTHTLEYGYHYRLYWTVWNVSATYDLYAYINGNGTNSWGGYVYPTDYNSPTGIYGAAGGWKLDNTNLNASDEISSGFFDIFPQATSDDEFSGYGELMHTDPGGVSMSITRAAIMAWTAITSIVIKVSASGGETFTGNCFLTRTAIGI